MKEIRMVDLKGQYEKIQDEVDHAIKGVIASTAFIKGPDVSLFEQELAQFLDVKHAIACANGTDALQVAMMALGLKPGDEIITTPFTFIATVEVIKLLGLTPVFVDVEADSFNINPELIESAISNQTKAIVPVHLFGQCAEMEIITRIAEKYKLTVIEDNAQAIGAEYIYSDGMKRKAGAIGDVGTTSFFPSKNLGCYGDGGAMFTNNPELADKLSTLANHGMNRRYYYDYVGVNSRLDTLQAAILRIKLRHLEKYNMVRKAAADYYDRAFDSLPGVTIPARKSYSTHIFHQYTLQVPKEQRDELHSYLGSKQVPSAIYYPVPLHLQTAYKDLGYKAGDFPVAERFSERVISLPMHTELDEEQLSYIAETVSAFFK